MNFLYGIFCITIGVTVAMNFLAKSKNEKIEVSTYPWMFIGVGYLTMFLTMAVLGEPNLFNIYLFQILSTIGLIWFLRSLEFRFSFVSVPISIGIPMFVTAWTITAYISEMSNFTALLPSASIMMFISFLIAVYFFIRSDEEALLKNVLGGLFVSYGLIKLLYVINIEEKAVIVYIGLFVLDYITYLIISFLLFFNIQYKKANEKNRRYLMLKDIVEDAPIGFVLLDREGNIIFSNSFIDDNLRKERIKKGTIYDLYNLFSVVDSYYYQKEWKKTLVSLDMRKRYFIRKTIYNYEIEFDFHQVRVHSSNKPEIFLNIQKRAVEEPKAVSEHIKNYIDHVSGLPNRYEMEQIFYDRIDANGERFGLILMSIANYREMVKYVGEETAQDFMTILIGYIKEVENVETVGKINTDTFEILTKDLSKWPIEDTVTDLIMNLQIPFRHKDVDLETKPVLGIALYPEDGIAYGELLKKAQIALLNGEYTPFGKVQYYDHNQMKQAHSQNDLENSLRSALDNGEFHIVYQPQYDTVDKIFRGFEALLRWESEGESVSPSLFIPIAEDLGIINEIGEWVLDNVVKNAKKWQVRYRQKFVVSVNVSAVQLEVDGFYHIVKDTLEKYDYPPQYLEIELTESKLLKGKSDIYTELRLIKKLGVKIALDDFGTGYSSLDYLRWLPFDVLKIDKSFIENLNNDTIEREIVLSIIDLMKKMNLETIAEGVENSEQLNTLIMSGCTYIQGHIYKKPLTELEVEGILGSNL